MAKLDTSRIKPKRLKELDKLADNLANTQINYLQQLMEVKLIAEWKTQYDNQNQ